MSQSQVVTEQSRTEADSPAEQQSTGIDRFMRKLLRVGPVDRSPKVEREAHRGFRIALVISGVRCIISYLLIPILVPILGVSGVLSAPISILISLIAVVNGIYSVRRFWLADHRAKWMYTWFIVIVFAILAVGVSYDIARLVAGP